MPHLHKSRNPSAWLPTRQPLCGVQMADGLRPFHALWPRTNTDIGRGLTLLHHSGNEVVAADPAGIAWDFSQGSGTRGVSAVSSNPGGAVTTELYIRFKGLGTAQYLAGMNDNSTGTSGTLERTMTILTSGAVTYYAYDGSERYVSSTALTESNFYHIVAVNDTALASLYINGGAPVTSVLNNSGFEGYGTPHFVVGAGNSTGTGGGSGLQCQSNVFYALQHRRVMPTEEIRYRAANPFAWLTSEG